MNVRLPETASIPERIAQLRSAMKQAGLAAWLVPSADPHLSEYLPGRWQGREWLSGFTENWKVILGPLHVLGEQEFPVPTLQVPGAADLAAVAAAPAVRLFAHHAGMVRPGFAVSEGNAADIAAILLSLMSGYGTNRGRRASLTHHTPRRQAGNSPGKNCTAPVGQRGRAAC